MAYKIGDILIFNGNIESDSHYSNFEVGRQYRIESIQKVQYDIDESLGYSSECILFENHGFGTLVANTQKYFTSLSDQRDNVIENLINK